MGQRVFDYAVDGSDVVVAVGDDWLQFARENGAPHLTRSAVIGRCLWEFVAGDATRGLYEVLFRRVRTAREAVALPFRCDSPDRFRFMELAIEPGDGPDLQLGGRLLREQARPYVNLLDRLTTTRSQPPLPACSVCLRVQILDTTWVEAEEAVERFDIFGASDVPSLDYRVCGDCVRLAYEIECNGDGDGAAP